MGLYFFFSFVLGGPIIALITAYYAIVDAFESGLSNIEGLFDF